jgi:acetyl/propionyl-CoA carboxylase alpha subunit
VRKLLIANRGEIARRVLRTAREMGIETVAVFSEPDRGAPFVREADEAVALGGASPAESYLSVDAILRAAERSGADAVHPGYGFLAEDAEFARRCAEAGLRFIGPAPEVLAVAGSKLEARRRMAGAAIPVLPVLELEEVPESERAEKAEGLGWPLLVKASAGGGGRGMRLVRTRAELGPAIESARREAAAAFGDDTLYLELYLDSPRHVEVQIFGDSSGRVVHLYERECSIQRRHQKIIEEAPSAALDAALRDEICATAVSAASAVGYVGAGTVEFLLAPSGEFFFLEMNARLQVEHPVTEAVTGLDLVRLQIEVARGATLPEQASIPPLEGYAIEARLYAEDPERDFLPSTGTFYRFEPGGGAPVRIDSGVESGSQVTGHYDSMLAKVVAHARTRREAAERLASALGRLRIHGPRTNRDLLVRVLRHPEFLVGEIDTGFLERHAPAELGAPLVDAAAARGCAAAAALAAQSERRREAPVLGSIPTGWRNVPSQLQEVSYETPAGRIGVEYRFDRHGLVLGLDGGEVEPVAVGVCTPGRVELEIDGVWRSYDVERVGARHFVDCAAGSIELLEIDRFPKLEADVAEGSLVAPLPGVVREVRVRVGDRVAEGDVLIVLEAMKLEHEIAAPVGGKIIELRAAKDDQVEGGRLLAVIEP